MVQLERLEIWSGAAGAEVVAGGDFAVVVPDLEVEGAPAEDVRDYDSEDGAYFISTQGNAGGVVTESDGVNEDVEELGGTPFEISLCTCKV